MEITQEMGILSFLYRKKVSLTVSSFSKLSEHNFMYFNIFNEISKSIAVQLNY